MGLQPNQYSAQPAPPVAGFDADCLPFPFYKASSLLHALRNQRVGEPKLQRSHCKPLPLFSHLHGLLDGQGI
jgi:hypothetical protein